MRRRWKLVPTLALSGAFALAGTATADSATATKAPRALTSTTPNQVIVWNRILLGILRTPGAQPAMVHPTRSLAMMHLAIADAVGAISRRFESYAIALHASPHASQDAAAAQAAHDVLVALYPTMGPALDTDLATSLQPIRDNLSKAEGVAVGARAARAILRLRADDGSSVTPPPFVPGTAPGDYQLTPPSFAQPVFTHWSGVMPFVLRAADQFRPGPPPAVGSAAYTRALDEVRSLGQNSSATRTPDQAEIGQFWSAPIQNYWNEIAQTASLQRRDSTSTDARLFAVLNASFADDVIAFYDAKYTYRFWRPVTAVTHDGRPEDAAWTPLVTTPGDPSYPGAHSVVSFGAAEILGNQFGRRMSFDVTSTVLPGVQRHFTSFGAAAQEAGLSRIYAGDHFRFDHAAGARLGRRIGRFVLGHALVLRPDGRHSRS